MNQGILADFTVLATDSIQQVSWMLERNNAIVVVVDDNSKYMGVIGKADLQPFHNMEPTELAKHCAAEAMRANYPVCPYTDDEGVYAAVRHLMADRPALQYVPALKDNELRDLFSRRRAFYLWHFEKNDLPRMNYAYIIKKALDEARALGLNAISAIEFGVATGNGLLACEFHAAELGRIYNIDVEVYGFDSGKGLPAAEHATHDMSYWWSEGLFAGDMEYLAKRLKRAKLVIGPIAQTAPAFTAQYNPAPMGAIMVDVDLYSSTIPILNLFDSDYQFLMPRIHMYFDDILNTNEFAGETLAVKEFNLAHEHSKISPEHTSVGRPEHKISNIKLCHNFKHPLYDKPVVQYGSMPPLRPFV